jgi:uncharacterized protein YqkB
LLGELRELEERFSEKVEINQRIETELTKFESMVTDDVGLTCAPSGCTKYWLLTVRALVNQCRIVRTLELYARC